MVFQMVKQGLFSEEEARNHPQSNVILSALGINETVDPEIVEVSYNKGDRFILCTDGFWGAMPEDKFLHYVTGKGKLDETIVNAANEVNSVGIRNGGGHDNLTAAIFEVKQNSKLKPKMRNSQIAVLCTLLLLLLASIILNVFTCKEYINQTGKSVFSEWFSSKQENNTEIKTTIEEVDFNQQNDSIE
jgi:protein phosphatase